MSSSRAHTRAYTRALSRSLSGSLSGGVTPVDVFIVAGQSNAVTNNTSLGALPAHIVSDPGIKIWNKATQAFKTYSAGVNSNQPGDTSPSIGGYWGPEAGFAYRYRRANPTRTVYLIKYAVGTRQLFESADGVTTTDWHPDSDVSELFGQAETEINAALAALVAANRTPTVRGVIWMQGENDATVTAQANAYAANLALFESAMRTRWGAPDGKLLIGWIQNIWTPSYATVQLAQASVVANSSLAALVDTLGYTLGTDSAHFNDAYVARFGDDLWEAYANDYHVNRITNGDFAGGTTTGWSGLSYNGTAVVSDPSVISVAGGKLRLTNSSGHTFAQAQQTLTGLVVGGKYLLQVGVTPSEPGYIRVGTSNTGADNVGEAYDSGSITSTGTTVVAFTATATTMYLGLFINSGNVGTCDYDNVVVKRIASNPAIDATPSAFSFTDVTGATVATPYRSNTITLAGFNFPIPISVTGATYSKNGGAYTSVSGTAVSGDTISLEVTSSGSNSTAVNAAFTAGGVSDTFTVTTEAGASSGVTGEIELIGTQIGSGNDGKENLLFSTQSLNSKARPSASDLSWTLAGCTITADDAVGPDGFTLADALVETGAINTEHRLTQGLAQSASSKAYVFEVVAKAGTRSRICVGFDDATNGYVIPFDLSGAQAGPSVSFGSGWSAPSASVQSLGSGWCRCRFFVTSSAATVLFARVGADSGSGTAAFSQTYNGVNGAKAVYIHHVAVYQVSATSNVLANLLDGNKETYWADYAYDAWAGIDVGSGKQATFTGMLVRQPNGKTTPTYAHPDLDLAFHWEATQLGVSPPTRQVSDDPTFATGVTTDSTAYSGLTPIILPRYDWHEVPLNSTARCARVRKPGGYLAGLRFIAQADASLTSAKPVAPTISPWGGKYPAGSTTVTIVSRTTSAEIYYTTDGSTPDNTDTLYAGPFSLSPGSTTTLKAVAYDATGTLDTSYSEVISAEFHNTGHVPKQDEYDDRGILIEAHGGGMIEVGDRIYRYGASCNMLTGMLYSSPTTTYSTPPRQDYGMFMYSCPADDADPDHLLNWRYEGQILAPPIVSGRLTSGLTHPSIVWNTSANKFRLYCNTRDVTYATGAMAIAEADTITGPWTWVNANVVLTGVTAVGCDPCAYQVTPGGTTYIVYASDANSKVRIAQMSADGLSEVANIVAWDGQREGNVLVNNGTNTFLINGKLYLYDATGDVDLKYLVLSGLDPMQAWPDPSTAARLLDTNPGTGNYLRSQPFGIFQPSGKAEHILCCDLWWDATLKLYGSRYAWPIVSFPTSTTITARQPASWEPSDIV